MEVSSPTTIYCDNLRSVKLARNLVFHTRTKHIEVHYHLVRESILSGEVEPVYVPIGRQIADIFTKPLDLDAAILRCTWVTSPRYPELEGR